MSFILQKTIRYIIYLFFFFSAGGLVTAVCPVVIKGNGLWVGWPGIHSTEPLYDIPGIIVLFSVFEKSF